jgi:SulP family sulfate permease
MMCEANHRVRAKLWKASVLSTLRKEDYAEDFATVLTLALSSQLSVNTGLP